MLDKIDFSKSKFFRCFHVICLEQTLLSDLYRSDTFIWSVSLSCFGLILLWLFPSNACCRQGSRLGSMFVCLCWGLTSQSTIFQSCRDGATASWVINQYFRGVKCLAQGHNTAAVGFESPTSRSGVRHSTTEPPRSPWSMLCTWEGDSSNCRPVT